MTDGTPLREQLAALIAPVVGKWVGDDMNAPRDVIAEEVAEASLDIAERLASAFILIGRCTEGGGGYCTVFVDRDLVSYPVGEPVYRFNASQ